MLRQTIHSSHASSSPTTSFNATEADSEVISTPESSEQSSSGKKTEGKEGLREKHEKISKSPATFPDARQQKLGQKKSKEKAEKLKAQTKAPEKTKESTESDSSEIIDFESNADESSTNTEPGTAQESLQSLTKRLRKLERDRDQAEIKNKEKLARDIQKDIDALKKTLATTEKGKPESGKSPNAESRKSETAHASPSTNSFDHHAVYRLIEERKAKVTELVQMILAHEAAASVDGDVTDMEQAEHELRELQKDLQTLYAVLEAPKSPATSSMPSTYRSTADPTLKTTTTTTTTTTTSTRSPRTTTQKTTATSPSASPQGKTAKLAEIHESSRDSVRKSLRNSSLLLNEDLRQYFSEAALEEIAVIDTKIQDRLERADALIDKAREIKEKLDVSEEIGDVNPKQLNADRNKAMKAAAAEWSAIGKLIEQRVKLEEKVLPQHLANPQKHDEEDFQDFINGFKSDNTLALEAKYKKALEDLGKKRESSPTSNALWNLAAGAPGFSVSFLISNTLFRLAPPEAQWLRVLGPALLAGTLHVITATPVVKQVMAQTWSSPSMAALNNNFKLRGAWLGEWFRGELQVPNYVSKDPTKTEKITIDQRLAEEPPFLSLLGNRYVDEEAGYYAYSMNYIFKAVAASAMAKYLAGGSFDSKLAEASLHGWAGFCSGAEYVMFQQDARSRRENAKASPVPTREIFGFEADALESLKHDLQLAIENVEVKGPNDDTHRKLAKALRRTEKALLAATLKSKRAGLMRQEFWAQFSKEAWRDTLSEVLGRAISLLTVAGVNEVTADMRKSPDPLQMFLGHMIPALVLIFPPGWTARPVYSGAIRALLQAFETARATRRSPQQPAAAPDDNDEVQTETEMSSQAEASSEIIAIDTDESDSEEQWQGNPTEREKERGGW